MSTVTQFFCDTCNRSKQVRTPGDENAQGYAEVKGDNGEVPRDWVSGRLTDEHRCPRCAHVVLVDVYQEEATDGEAEGSRLDPGPTTTARAAGRGAWPAASSPFDGS